MGNFVDGTFSMDDENMLLGSFFKRKFQKINNHIYPMNLVTPIGRLSPITR